MHNQLKIYCFVAYTRLNMFRALVPIIRSPLQLPLQPLVTYYNKA
jgi:hypothetical protein